MMVLMVCSMAFAKSGLNAIGGINYSTVAGDDVEDADNLMGFRFGVEKTLTNGLIAGAIYSQRGYSYSLSEDFESFDFKSTFNYLAGYVLKPFPMQTGIDILAGAELGYFLNGKFEFKECEYDDCYSNTENIDGDDWEDEDGNRIDYGIVVGGRFAINQQISLVGTYFFGLANLFDEDDFEIKNRSFQINVSYGF